MIADDRGLIAITGANGTIGYACVVYALQTGYRVRCILRREDAFATIKLGPSIQNHLSRIECAVVPDNSIDGAYDEALTDVQYVVHIAGAWPMPHLHPDNDIYHPFIKSTSSLLNAARKSGTVKRIVFTQAGAGLVDTEDGDTLGNKMQHVLNEHVPVNQASLTHRPPLPTPHHAYTSAKAQCMTTLNDLRISNTTPFSIVQIIPGTVIGPSEFATTAPQALAHMDRQSKALLFDDSKPRYGFGFVHVQDCARVHIEALDEAKVKVDEIPPWFVAAASVQEGVDGEGLWGAAADMVEREFRKEVHEGVFKVGREKAPINMPFRADSRMTEKMLLGGEEIRGLEESVREVARWYVGLREKEGVSV